MTVKHSQEVTECAEAYDMAVLKYLNGEGVLNFPEKIEEYKIRIANGWHEDLKCKICR